MGSLQKTVLTRDGPPSLLRQYQKKGCAFQLPKNFTAEESPRVQNSHLCEKRRPERDRNSLWTTSLLLIQDLGFFFFSFLLPPLPVFTRRLIPVTQRSAAWLLSSSPPPRLGGHNSSSSSSSSSGIAIATGEMGVLALFCVAALLLAALVCPSHGLDVKNPLYRFKRYQESPPSSDPSDCTALPKQPVILTNSHNISLDVRMPGVTPTTSDTYLCTVVPVPTSRDAYIVDFLPHATMDTAHHMLLYGCRTPVKTSGYWDCGSGQSTCEDEGSIMYAWARNAPPTKLPRDVGFKVGGNSKISYFVLQIHYGDVTAFRDHHKDCSGLTLRMTSKPQPFIAGMYLLMSVDTIIAPGKRVTNADIACDYDSYPIYPFAFRTHTHRLGKVVSGYRVRDGKWSLIGRQSPLLPQAFYAANQVDIKYGDTVAARCVFTGEGRTANTYIGGTAKDEMCNFYIMYYMDSKHAVPFQTCMQTGSKKLFRHIPPEANVPIAVSPDHMMSHMMGHQGAPSTDDKSPLEPKGEEEEALDQGYHLEEVKAWPESPLQLGQVSGLALDSDSNLVIFHRGEHRWGVNSFDNQAVYQQRALGPIQQSTILVVDPVKGNVLKASGRNMFYLPHGITTDKDNNYWVTDVALHQVLKLSAAGTDEPLVVLGEAFQPGSDQAHFCQPTDVAVDLHTGSLYVSDGYCNARLLKFSAGGKYLSEWGAGSSDRRKRVPFFIPHSLVYLPDRQELCVADRENGRIQCFVADSGEFVKEIKRDEFGGEVFAISYTPAHGGLLYAVNGEPPYGRSAPLRGFVINYSTKEIVDAFSPDKQLFQMPHDIVVNKDGAVFVGDAGSDSVIKFTSEKGEHRSVKKGGIEVQEIEETETFIQTNLKPLHKVSVSMAVAQQKLPVAPVKHPQAPQPPAQVHLQHELPAAPVKQPQAPQPPAQVHLQQELPVKQPQAPQPPAQVHLQQQDEEEKRKAAAKQSGQQGASPAIVTTLLLIPLVLVISIGVFIRWRKSRMYTDGCEVKLEPNSAGGILGKLRGKAAGGLNLGHFFASHKGYTRQGFDRLSTEGSDQEKDDEATDSENEEYSAPPPPPPPAIASSSSSSSSSS